MSATPDPPQKPRSLAEWLKARRWVRALGAMAFIVATVPSWVDFPYLTRWQGWGALVVLATFCFSLEYASKMRTVLRATAAACGAAGLIVVLGPGMSNHGNVSAKPLPPRPHMVVAPTGDAPQAVAAGFGYVWVLHADGTLLGFDASGTVRVRLAVPGRATGLAICGDALAVAFGPGYVGRFDPVSGRRLSRYHYAVASGRLLCGGRSLLADKHEPGSIVRMSARTLELRYELAIGSGLTDMSYGRGTIWATDANRWQVVGIDARTRQLVARVSTMENPTLAAFGAGSVWVVHALQACLMRIDIARQREVGPGIPLGPAPQAVAVHGGTLFVVDFDDGTLRRIDLATHASASPPIRLGRDRRLVGVTAYRGRVYVLDSAHDQLLILTRTVLADLARSARGSNRRRGQCPATSGY